MVQEFSIIKVFNKPDENLQGNTSAVLLFNSLPSKAKMQQIAADLNQPATTFLSPIENNVYEVRWFAPDMEIDLCGHGSAAAMVFLNRYFKKESIKLISAYGSIEGGITKDQFYLFIEPIEVIDHLKAKPEFEEAFGVEILDYFTTHNKDIVLVQSESVLANMQPNFKKLAQLEPFGYAVTAPGDHVDFVSRTIVPKTQQLEDHATGSSHAALVPFWYKRIPKKELIAKQLSPRGGYFNGQMALGKVMLKGYFEIVIG